MRSSNMLSGVSVIAGALLVVLASACGESRQFEVKTQCEEAPVNEDVVGNEDPLPDECGEPGASVLVVVITPDGKPIKGAEVRAEAIDHHEPAELDVTRTGASGSLALTVDGGRYNVTAWKSGFRPDHREVTVETNGEADVRLVLEPI